MRTMTAVFRNALGVAVLSSLLTAGACSSGPSDTSDPCQGVTCSFHGFCITDGVNAYCSCDSGYHPVGPRCDENDPLNPCDGVSCNAHGACRVEADLPTCDCYAGYELDDSGLLCFPTSTDGGPDDGASGDGDAEDDGVAEADADVDDDVVGDTDGESGTGRVERIVYSSNLGGDWDL